MRRAADWRSQSKVNSSQKLGNTTLSNSSAARSFLHYKLGRLEDINKVQGARRSAEGETSRSHAPITWPSLVNTVCPHGGQSR